jgi:hypothetical protein
MRFLRSRRCCLVCPNILPCPRVFLAKVYSYHSAEYLATSDQPTTRSRCCESFADCARWRSPYPHECLQSIYVEYVHFCLLQETKDSLTLPFADKHDKNWAWTNYLSLRALQQAENVRAQLQRTMERFEIDLISLDDQKKLFINIRKALVAGFFMQVAHKEGEKATT